MVLTQPRIGPTNSKSFFDEEFKKFETPFLLHNINIWYEPCDGCSNNVILGMGYK